MFLPNRSKLKYKNYHRAHPIKSLIKGLPFPFLQSGILGLKILKYGFLFPNQLKAAFQTINKLLKKKATIYFFAFPNASLTTKPENARMGKGKGKTIAKWVFKVLAGFLLCEIHTHNIPLAKRALQIAQHKLPLPSKIILNLSIIK